MWDIFLKCDLLIVSEVMEGTSEPPMSINNIMDGIRVKIQNFRRFQVSHVKHQGNRSAHLLTCNAKNILDYFAWIEENPIMIESTLIQDVIFLSHFLNKSTYFS